ncbi:MAG: hypothetical protein HOI92_07415 [Alphaproteobacteria bacterium]|jgi:hypothetical protein|nr:hypothetical protein [Alphaproteobacteria bacterium]MDA8675681.1 hypothetical protein [Alphaproteobacteria bacterium]MDG2467320.1 hypothetical protein [Alphaproteobacteria bacterium]
MTSLNMISDQTSSVHHPSVNDADTHDETIMTDHLMDHFSTWYLATVLSVDLFKLFLHHYRESHPAED